MARLWLEVMQEVCVHEVSGSPAGSYGKVVLKFLHGGPAGSLAVRRGLDRLKRRLACGLKSCKRYHGYLWGMRARADVVCMLEVRDQWEEGIAIPHVFADMEGADVGVCGRAAAMAGARLFTIGGKRASRSHTCMQTGRGPTWGCVACCSSGRCSTAPWPGSDIQNNQKLQKHLLRLQQGASPSYASPEVSFSSLTNSPLWQVRYRWEEGIAIPHVFADKEGPDVGVCGVLQQWQVLTAPWPRSGIGIQEHLPHVNCPFSCSTNYSLFALQVRDRWEEGIVIPHVYADREGPDVGVCGVLQQWQVLNCAMARKRWRRARVRDRWEEGIAIPHVFADKEGPDVSVCGVLQQWQVLNCAMARKRWRRARVRDRWEEGIAIPHVFADKEGPDVSVCGVLQQWQVLNWQDCGSETGGMRLLMTGARMCVPEVQDGLLITSMYIAELEEAVMHTGSLNIAHKRLFSDMQAFKNGRRGSGGRSGRDAGGTGGEGNDSSGSSDEEGCVQGKGERSTIGYLSTRMSGPDNKWRLYWSEAKPMPALLQPPLFDECEAGCLWGARQRFKWPPSCKTAAARPGVCGVLGSASSHSFCAGQQQQQQGPCFKSLPFVRDSSSSKARLEDAVKTTAILPCLSVCHLPRCLWVARQRFKWLPLCERAAARPHWKML
ncbi:unnamed protein product [Closterium sp. NIES-65]|nr:unnamed protein product [Closterium sp. NIES-65]